MSTREKLGERAALSITSNKGSRGSSSEKGFPNKTGSITRKIRIMEIQDCGTYGNVWEHMGNAKGCRKRQHHRF